MYLPTLQITLTNSFPYAIFGTSYTSLRNGNHSNFASSSEIFPLTLVGMAKDKHDFAVLKAKCSLMFKLIYEKI
jgi:hypothetical protein